MATYAINAKILTMYSMHMPRKIRSDYYGERVTPTFWGRSGELEKVERGKDDSVSYKNGDIDGILLTISLAFHKNLSCTIRVESNKEPGHERLREKLIDRGFQEAHKAQSTHDLEIHNHTCERCFAFIKCFTEVDNSFSHKELCKIMTTVFRRLSRNDLVPQAESMFGDLPIPTNHHRLLSIRGFNTEAIPKQYICPLSGVILDEPVVDPTMVRGDNFSSLQRVEKAFLTKSLRLSNDISPFTRKPVTQALVLDVNLRQEIDSYIKVQISLHALQVSEEEKREELTVDAFYAHPVFLAAFHKKIHHVSVAQGRNDLITVCTRTLLGRSYEVEVSESANFYSYKYTLVAMMFVLNWNRLGEDFEIAKNIDQLRFVYAGTIPEDDCALKNHNPPILSSTVIHMLYATSKKLRSIAENALPIAEAHETIQTMTTLL